MNSIISPSASVFSDDGFSITATEPWFKVKVQLIQNYLSAFVANGASRVDEFVVVDLFAGSGLYSIGHQKEIFAGSCLASLQTDLPISKWIFCEEDSLQAKALKIRVNKYFRGKNVIILESEKDDLVDKLRMYVPASKGSYKVAVFCLIDPFSLDISFATITKLAAMGFSFVIPFTLGINDRHNYSYYLKEQSDKVKRFIGSDLSRMENVQSNFHFYKHIVKIFQNNMLVQGLTGSVTSYKINSKLMDLPQYSIGYFSKQVSPKLIHQDVKIGEEVQFQLF